MVSLRPRRAERPALDARRCSGSRPRSRTGSGDLRDGELIAADPARARGRRVFHLAAQTIVGTVARVARARLRDQHRGTWTLLEACRERGVERVVVASSDKAYGAHDELPYREDFALQPTAPYDASKAAADLIARSYWHTYGLPVAVTRFANLYGGGDLNFSRLVPEAVSAALDGRAPGAPLRRLARSATSSTSRTPPRPTWRSRDALDRDEVRGEAFNAGGGAPHSVRRGGRADRASSPATGVEPDIRGDGQPGGEIDRQYVDATKLREPAAGSPRVELEEGLARTLEWYREHPEVRPPE